ncbi:MAG: hypothetical protein HBSAPP03_09540 [Phycisphaerae bacterium]|nr:MAG: hypothetical protein HBSAPP03_09540 [Phycisphaerae bacterium]
MVGRRQIDIATRSVNQAMERLATGKRVNRAADDPSGVAAITELTARERTLRAQIDHADRESAYLAARDGAQSVVSDLLIELQGHVVAAANRGGLSPEEIAAHQLEAESILKTIDHLSQAAEFNGRKLLDGLGTSTLGQHYVTVTGADGQPETITMTLAGMMGGGPLNLVTGNLETAQKVVKSATTAVSTSRSAIGNRMLEIDSQRRTGLKELEGVMGEKSRVEDADYAAETSNLVRARVLQDVALYTTQLAGELMAKTAMALLKVA